MWVKFGTDRYLNLSAVSYVTISDKKATVCLVGESEDTVFLTDPSEVAKLCERLDSLDRHTEETLAS
jgi:hypothetical protein